jgi:transcriptional regulator with XRE-family HTH domain
MKTGEKIRQLRRKRKLTQAEMADALNLSQRAYSKIENNEVQIKINRLEEIAKLLSVAPKELLPDLPNQNFENVQYSQIGNEKIINNANENERALYEKIIGKQEEEINYLKDLIGILKK